MKADNYNNDNTNNNNNSNVQHDNIDQRKTTINVGAMMNYNGVSNSNNNNNDDDDDDGYDVDVDRNQRHLKSEQQEQHEQQEQEHVILKEDHNGHHDNDSNRHNNSCNDNDNNHNNKHDNINPNQNNSQQQQQKLRQSQLLRLSLNPPISSSEQFRDTILRTLDHIFFQRLGIIVLLLVIADGAFFFFLLMGWHTLCHPRTNCQPRNWWYNWSIQVLNVLFTYMGIVSMPWRCSNFFHTLGISCPHRSNNIGSNIYGYIPNPPDIWFYIPLRKRTGILLFLLFNCIFQFINQGTRIKFYTFELQNVSPGNIWTNVFFASSFICAGVGAVWLLYESNQVRIQYPHIYFGVGPIDSIKEWCKNIYYYKNNDNSNINNNTKNKMADDDDDVELEHKMDHPVNTTMKNVVNGEPSTSTTIAVHQQQQQQHPPSALQVLPVPPSIDEESFSHSTEDPTREMKMRNVSGKNRSHMRLFAM